MKNYIQMLIITLIIVGSSLRVNFISAEQSNFIVSTTSGSNSLVDAIKRYSDITGEDVDKWKFLKLILGRYDVVSVLAMTAYSGAKAHQLATAGFDYAHQQGLLSKVQELTPSVVMENMPNLPDAVKGSKFWAGVVGLGVGAFSYSVLYPRMRHGVLAKVQNFIDVCGRLEIARKELWRAEFPDEWGDEEPIAVCRALNNLVQQGGYAVKLLNYVGTNDTQVREMLRAVRDYNANLRENRKILNNYCAQFIQDEQQQEERSLRREVAYTQLFGMKLQNVKNVLSIMKTIGNVLYTGAKDVMTWTAENPLPAGLIGVMASYWWKKPSVTAP